jgi:hypothetical protein
MYKTVIRPGGEWNPMHVFSLLCKTAMHHVQVNLFQKAAGWCTYIGLLEIGVDSRSSRVVFVGTRRNDYFFT